MNKLKLPLFIAAMLVASFGIFAFNTQSPKPVVEQWYELKDMGNPLDRNDYEPAGGNPGCPTVHTSDVCGILAEDDGGIPTATSFNAIKSASSNFTTAYPAKVQYRTP
ncbi:MAG: hypothetical protein EOP51_33415 [Sphingobacteriales bacterium]|nr:MAG: hypothetical protein EOP51_33415 [Sphingobacteriales bacterium]